MTSRTRRWNVYGGCSGISGCHYDHMHLEFGPPGAYRKTTWWTG